MLVATLTTPLAAAAQQHLPIPVRHIGADPVGKQYVEDLGVRLRSSNRYDITIAKDDAFLGLHLMSTDANDKAAALVGAIDAAVAQLRRQRTE